MSPQRVQQQRSKLTDREVDPFESESGRLLQSPTTKGSETGAGQNGWMQTGLYASIADDDSYASDDEDGYGQSGAQGTKALTPVQSAIVAPEWNPAESMVAEPQTPFDAYGLWRKTLGELQLQLASSTYYTWLHNTWVEAYEDGDLIVGTANTYARDWLDNRLKSIIRRTLKSIAGRTLEVRFVVASRERTTQEANARQYEQERAPLPTAGASGKSSIQQPTTDASYLEDDEPRAQVPSTVANRIMLSGVQLNPQYTFESWVVGSNNRLASAAAQAVAERPGYKFNPLFVHGGVGLGKTHLLHAIGNAMAERGQNVLYVTSEQFTNDLIAAIRTQTTDQFRTRYRALDVLLIDDIQFIAGKESTQEEFFHTFNHLQQLGKQVVLSSDRPPRALQLLEERLRSRFEGGIRVDVSAPDYETRVAILQSKAQRMGIHVETEVLSLVAQRVDSNIRELEGALNHLFLQSQLERTQLNLALANSSLAQVAPHRKPCDPARMIEIIAHHLHLLPGDITGARRTKSIADARHIAMYLLREDSALSLPQIGALFGGRDHSTVAHGVAKITSELQRDEQLRNTIANLRERIYA